MKLLCTPSLYLNDTVLDLQEQKSTEMFTRYHHVRAKCSLINCVVLFVLAMMTLGCGGGGVSNNVSAPVGLQVAYDASSLKITLKWTPPESEIHGYNLEMSFDGQSFSKVNNDLIDAKVTGLYITFYDRPPEAIVIKLRLQAVNGTVLSAWSNVVQFVTPVLDPESVHSAFDPAAQAVIVRWKVVSLAAVKTRIERALSDKNNSILGPWITLSTQPSDLQKFIDNGVDEEKYYAYRITNIVGSFESGSAIDFNQMSIPLFLPKNIKGDTVQQGVKLSWENSSYLAKSITVLRGNRLETPNNELATLDSGVQSYLDTTVGFGYYSYALRINGVAKSSTSPVIVLAAPNSTGSLSVQQKIISSDTDSILGAVMRPDGIWALVNRPGPIEIKATEACWPKLSLSDWYAYGPDLIKINSLGWPVLLYFRYDLNPIYTKSLNKVIYDGADWSNAQVVGPIKSDYIAGLSDRCSWLLDSTDGIHAVMVTHVMNYSYMIPVTTYMHVTPAGTDVIPLSMTNDATFCNLFLDNENRPHFVLSGMSDNTLSEWWPGAAPGTWNKLVIASGPSFSRMNRVVVQSTHGDGAWMIIVIDGRLHGFRKVAGTWLPSQTIYSMPSPSAPLCIGIAQSHDGSRTAILMEDMYAGLVVLNKSGDIWMPTLVGLPDSSGISVAFDASNRLHILAYNLSSRQIVDYHEK